MVVHEIFGIGWGELMLLIILAFIFFGPEKLPAVSRKAARVVYTVRAMANQATSQLKAELGPEYQDLTLADLNPKTFVQKTLLADVQGDLDDIKKELDGVKSDLTASGKEIKGASNDVKSLVNASLGSGAAAAASEAAAPAAQTATAAAVETVIPWDTEAT